MIETMHPKFIPNCTSYIMNFYAAALMRIGYSYRPQLKILKCLFVCFLTFKKVNEAAKIPRITLNTMLPAPCFTMGSVSAQS